jgi:hypothetical protein
VVATGWPEHDAPGAVFRYGYQHLIDSGFVEGAGWPHHDDRHLERRSRRGYARQTTSQSAANATLYGDPADVTAADREG